MNNFFGLIESFLMFWKLELSPKLQLVGLVTLELMVWIWWIVWPMRPLVILIGLIDHKGFWSVLVGDLSSKKRPNYNFDGQNGLKIGPKFNYNGAEIVGDPDQTLPTVKPWTADIWFGPSKTTPKTGPGHKGVATCSVAHHCKTVYSILLVPHS